MKKFMKRATATLLMLALFCGMIPAAFAASCTVKLDACGGVDVPMELTTGLDGKLTTLPTPVMQGYTFDGWYTELVAGEQVTTSTVFEEDSTIYAYWISNDLQTTEQQPEGTGFWAKVKSHVGTIVIAGITAISIAVLAINAAN